MEYTTKESSPCLPLGQSDARQLASAPAFWTLHWPFLPVAAAWLATRYAIMTAYWPAICADTHGYEWIFRFAIDPRTAGFDGTRGPGYPLLMFLGWLMNGASPHIGMFFTQSIVFLQMLLGLGVAIMVYAIVCMITRNRILSAAAAMLQVLALNAAQLEDCLLSEALAAFLITLIAFWCVRIFCRDRSHWSEWTLLGLLIAATTLTRPNNLFFLPLLITLIMTGWFQRLTFAQRCSRTFMVAACGGLPVFLWCLTLWMVLGNFTLSTLTGFQLSHKVIDYVDLAPDQFAPLRQVLIEFERPYLNMKFGKKCPVPLDSRIWFARSALIAIPQYRDGTADLERDLRNLSFTLIRQHPDLYAGAVAESCVRFWQPMTFTEIAATNVTDPKAVGNITIVRLPALQDELFQISSYVMVLEYAAYLLLPVIALAALFTPLWTGRRQAQHFAIFGTTTLLTAMFSCALVEYGNGRFVLPYQPVVFVTAAVGAWGLVYRQKVEVIALE